MIDQEGATLVVSNRVAFGIPDYGVTAATAALDKK
jgi:hypothetical protein